jgi:hypothetical protein
VEQHDVNPIDQDGVDPWDRLADQFAALRRKLRDTYRQSAGSEGPSEEDIREALRTLGGAWDRLAEAIEVAVRDEQVRAGIKQAATGFVEAVGSAFSELGAEMRRGSPSEDGDDGPGP